MNKESEREIKVSIIMLVYNHEKYIAEAIESVINQKTDFDFELLIGEDCSTDNSRRIIEKYEKKYPNIIKVKYWGKNIGMNGNGFYLLKNATGKYIAALDGDDYYTDEYKLQKQFNFLEKNPEYSCVYSNVCCVDKEGKEGGSGINKYPIKDEGEYSFEMIKKLKLIGQASSSMYINFYKVLDEKVLSLMEDCKCNGDHKIGLVLACIGKIYYMKDIMTCHRVIFKGDSWSAQTVGKNLEYERYLMYLELGKFSKEGFGRQYCEKGFEKRIVVDSIRTCFREFNFNNIKVTYKLFSLL